MDTVEIEAECAECPIGHVRTFASEDRAVAAGWLLLEDASRHRRFWLCPTHARRASDVMLREGLATVERRIHE